MADRGRRVDRRHAEHPRSRGGQVSVHRGRAAREPRAPLCRARRDRRVLSRALVREPRRLRLRVQVRHGPRDAAALLRARHGVLRGGSWLGTLSGKLYLRYGDREVMERTGDENSVGPVEFYRRDCFQEIGGFVREVCWDGIDGHMCRMRGWVASSVNDPELRIVHLRADGVEPPEPVARPAALGARQALHGLEPALHGGRLALPNGRSARA